ncbi:MAG: sugar phosphate isomerase/epimerase family protein [Candidatus Latescibacterota bacterium]|jgi:sugar phosphate isomerase/epimerase
MNLGCFSNLPDPSSPGGFMDLEAFIRFVHELKLDAVDFHLGKGFRSKEPDYLEQIRRLCHDCGLPVGYVGSVGNLAGPEEEVVSRMAQARFDVGVAAALGAPLVRLFAVSLRDGADDRQALWEQMIANFQLLADEAADKGVTLALQNHNNRNLAATGADVLAILDQVGRDNFTYILDTGEWLGSIGASPLGESDPGVDIYTFMEQAAPRAAYVRAKIYRVASGREEWIDYERVVGILKGAGFDGTVSIVLQNQTEGLADTEAVRLAAGHLLELLAD